MWLFVEVERTYEQGTPFWSFSAKSLSQATSSWGLVGSVFSSLEYLQSSFGGVSLV